MARIWDAERVVEADLAQALIKSQFPGLNPGRLESLGVGFDNTAYLVDGLYVFRFPRRQVAVPLLQTESAVLPKLGALLPLPVPEPAWLGEPEARFPWPFAGYRFIPGTTACRADLSESERAAAASHLGAFLKVLHSLPVAAGESWGLTEDRIGKLDLEKRIPQAESYLEEVAGAGLVDVRQRLSAVIAESRSLKTNGPRVVVHGDFYARHLLVDSRHRLSGVIDWGDLHLGDPAVDIGIAMSFLPRAAHGAFASAYGPVSEETWLLARFRALYISLVLVSYGHDSGDQHLVREGRQALRYIADGQAEEA